MQVADSVVKEADDKLHLSCGIHCNIITMETYIKKALHYVSLTFCIYQNPSQKCNTQKTDRSKSI